MLDTPLLSSWCVEALHLKMWIALLLKLHVEEMCAIRACVCEGEATGRGALRCRTAFKGSGSVSERVLGG